MLQDRITGIGKGNAEFQSLLFSQLLQFCRLSALSRYRFVRGYIDSCIEECFRDLIVSCIRSSDHDEINSIASLAFCFCHFLKSRIGSLLGNTPEIRCRFILLRISGEAPRYQLCAAGRFNGPDMHIRNE